MSYHILPDWAVSTRALATTLASLSLAGGLLISYASRIEPRWAEVVRITLPLPRLDPSLDGLTIAQISDTHVSGAYDVTLLRHFVATTNALRPDIAVVTGDMFARTPRSAEMSAEAIAALRAPHGVYVVMGNHERYLPPEDGEMPFHRPGLTVLCNQAQELRVNGASLWMLGLDDLLRGHGDLSLALRDVPDEACKVLLVHEPDFADQAAYYPIDLQLSGHTHGGQVRMPGLGALVLPRMGHKYPMGLYRVRNTWLYTNRGLGTDSLPVRFNCRPEITLFTLRSAPTNRRTPVMEGT